MLICCDGFATSFVGICGKYVQLGADEAGNWQEQTLSPAFRIDALVQSAVTEVRDNDAHEVARYSIDGKRVDTSHHGVTIIRMSDGTAHKVLLQ